MSAVLISVSNMRALRAALRWRNRNTAAPWSIMFFDVLRKQEQARTRDAALRLERLADVLFDCAMDPKSPYSEDQQMQAEYKADCVDAQAVSRG